MSSDLIDELMHQAEVPQNMSDSAMIRLLLVISKQTLDQARKTNGTVIEHEQRLKKLEDTNDDTPSILLAIRRNPKMALLIIAVVTLAVHTLVEAITPTLIQQYIWQAIF